MPLYKGLASALARSPYNEHSIFKHTNYSALLGRAETVEKVHICSLIIHTRLYSMDQIRPDIRILPNNKILSVFYGL